MAAQLTADGHTVLTGVDGIDAFEIFNSQPFDERLRVRPAGSLARIFHLRCNDLVLTDLSMPRMNGQQLASAIKSQNPDIPVIRLRNGKWQMAKTLHAPSNQDTTPLTSGDCADDEGAETGGDAYSVGCG